MAFGILTPLLDFLDINLYDLKNTPSKMETNIERIKGGRRYSIKLPGFSKENIRVSLKDGIMAVSASASSSSEDEKKEEGKYIICEHTSSSCHRTFQLNKDVTEDDIHAKYTNGILIIDVAMKEKPEPEPEKEKQINIL